MSRSRRMNRRHLQQRSPLLLLALLVLGAGWAHVATGTVALTGTTLLAATADPAQRRLTLHVATEALAATIHQRLATAPAAPDGRVQAGAMAALTPPIHLAVRVDADFRVTSARVVEFDPGIVLAVGARAPAQGLEASVPAAVAGEGWLRGQRLVEIVVTPSRPGTKSGTLEIGRTIVVELNGRRSLAAATPPPPVPWERKVERSLARTTLDLRTEIASSTLSPPAGGRSRAFSPTFRPSADGSPVEYVIVTTEVMAEEYQRLADWKTSKGVQAVVRTIEWIDSSYPNGADPAEQVRFFLRDAYDHWGTLWVLLGGDTDYVPLRYALSTLAEPDELIPTDLYFSCLDGNWNEDGDQYFGEASVPPAPGDHVDLLPEVFVGRAPTTTAIDAGVFVDKILAYEQTPVVDERYPASALFLGEELSPILDGADLCEQTRAFFPAEFRTVRMYENYTQYPGAVPENVAAVVDSLNVGFGIVVHVGHGSRNVMSVGNGSLNNAAINQLANGNRQSMIFAINCSSASIDFNCIGERFLKNPDGGAIAYIGSSRLANAGAAQEMQDEFFRVMFEDTVVAAGEALALAKLPLVGSAQGENLIRWMTFAMLLLGDPETPIWHRQPAAVDVDHATTYELGTGSLGAAATVGGAPIAGARLALRKPDEAFAWGLTDAGGEATLPFQPTTTGDISLTLTRPGYLPYQASVTAISTSLPFVHLLSVALDDDSNGASSGNGDGLADAGETLELALTLHNAGGATATAVTAQLTSADVGPHLTILQDTVHYDTLVASGSSTGSATFLVQLASSAPAAFQPVFLLAIDEATGNWNDTFVLPVHDVALEHYGHDLDDPLPGGNGNGLAEPGEAITYTVRLRNVGTGQADEVTGQLRVLNVATLEPDPNVTVTDDSATFGSLPSGALQTGDAFACDLSPSAVVEDLRLELTWSDQYGVREVALADLLPPAPVSDLQAVGAQSSVTLTWTPPSDSDVKGYDILRADQPQGDFTRVNEFTADGTARYVDANLPGLTRFYYAVVARDSSYNASVPSAIVSGTTNPPLAEGWPHETGQSSAAGVVVDDVDGESGLEVVTGADAVYVWHADGSELLDGDQNPQTSGVFSTDGQAGQIGFNATPAIADLDRDGDLEIIATAWSEAQVYVWGADAVPEPGWPQAIGGDYNWSSPAADDLDLDGDLEVVVVSGLHGKVFAWHHDGVEVVDGDENPTTNGVLYDSPTSFLYSSPGLGNVGGDPELEIVVTANHSSGYVYVLDLAGELLPGWPFEAGGQLTASPALVDFDADGLCEIVFAAEDDSIYVLRGDASHYPGWPQRAMVNSASGHTGSVSIGDVDADGAPDLIFAANDGRMHVRGLDGELKPGWEEVFFAQEALTADVTQCTPTVADIDDDGLVEIVVGAEDGMVYGWNHDGSEANGFPVALPGEIRGAVTLWDIDHDNFMEMALITMDRHVYIWDLPGQVRADRLDWPFFRHDVRNTGRYDAPYTSIGVAEPATNPVAAPAARLLPAVPNPFNPSTMLRFVVPGQSGAARPVRLGIYDVGGRLVRELVRGPVETGELAVRWNGRRYDGRRAASGVYLIRFEVSGQVLQGKVTLLQ